MTGRAVTGTRDRAHTHTARTARGLGVAAVLAAGALLLSGCGGGSSASARTPAPDNGCGPTQVEVAAHDLDPITDSPRPKLPVTVESADGREVTVTDTSRVLAVNLYGSIGEIVFNLGQGDRLIGRDIATTLPEAEHLPVVTKNGHDLSTEAVLSLDPTLVITDDTVTPNVVDQIRRTGVPVVLVDSEQTLPNISLHIEQIAAALGVADDGAKLIRRIEKQIDSAQAAVPRTDQPLHIAFLYLRGNAGVYLIGGKGAGSDAMIESVGGVDVGSSLGLSKFKALTAEALVQAAPDVILVMDDGLASVGGVDGLAKLPGVGQTPAGENRRFVTASDGDLLSFGASTGRVIQALGEAVYRDCHNPSGE